MRKFNITHPEYNGEAVVTYDEKGRFCELNLLQTDMSIEQRHYFKSKVASYVGNVEAKFDKDTTIVEADYVITLEDFTREYPYKRNTHLLPNIWGKMNKTEQLQAFLAAKEYRRYCQRQGKWYTPRIAASWLNNKEYLNDWKEL